MKNILIICGTPLRDDTNTGKTLQTMFSGCQAENLHQLYFSIQTPNLKACSSYYRVYEYQLIKSVFGLFPSKCGGEVPVHADSQKPEQMSDALTRKRRNLFIIIMRELLWHMSHYNNKHLKKWISDFRPNHIFAILSGSTERSDLIRWISGTYGCPVTLFVTDDYYHDVKQSRNLIRKFFFKNRQKHIDRMAKCCDKIVGCSMLAAKEFGEKYHLPYEVIYTPVRPDFLDLPIKKQNDGTVIFRYFGNMGLGRWNKLEKIGRTIAEINRKKGKQAAFLEVYSPVTDKKITDHLQIAGGAAFKGFVKGSDFTDLLATADVAIHVESFDADMIRRTRLSISTKIADYLGAGKCILAMGPQEVASMQHLADVAYIVNDETKLDFAMEELIDHPEKRELYQQKARNLAEDKHKIAMIAEQVRNLFL